MKNCKKYFLLFICILISFAIYAEDITISLDDLPEIPELKSKDTIFREYSDIVLENYQIMASRANSANRNKNNSESSKTEPQILFFKYTVKQGDGMDTILKLAARCNVTQETIATINNLSNAKENLTGKTLILPTVRGLFISANSDNSIHVLLRNRTDLDLQNINVWYNYKTLKFAFFPNTTFTPSERAYFLDATLALPIDAGLAYVSSNFGRRKNPFSGEWKNHNGIDFAAPDGTPVKAVKNGIVSACVKDDPTFGNYIIVRHNTNNMTSVYAHLSEMCIKAKDEVLTGEIIGYVGHTGMVTGSHLHFEIKIGGEAEDPAKMLHLNNL